jgi:hypothetical protein
MEKIIMLIVRVAAIACLLIFPTLTNGGEEKTGNDLLNGCISIINVSEGVRVSDDDSISAIAWAGYLSGFADSYSITSKVEGKPTTLFCYPPQGIASVQAARIIAQYLRENPVELHQSSRVCALNALSYAFPCR